VGPGEVYVVPQIVLVVAAQVTQVTVGLMQVELAEVQIMIHGDYFRALTFSGGRIDLWSHSSFALEALRWVMPAFALCSARRMPS
jgi:hypothetical protein